METNLHSITDNQFTAYSNLSVTIKDITYSNNIIVTNQQIYPLNTQNIHDLKITDLSDILLQKPDLILFGTKDKIITPQYELLLSLQKLSIGYEVMVIQALCRTHNFLVGENRKLASILFF